MNPDERRSADQTGQNEDLVSDVQYLLQAFTGMEDRLTKLEESISRQGKDINIEREILGSMDQEFSIFRPFWIRTIKIQVVLLMAKISMLDRLCKSQSKMEH